MNQKREDKNCFNCKNELIGLPKFCSNCGQKVDSNNLKLKTVFNDSIETYLSLDSRFGRSIIPFLFKPGQLTLAFNAGRRKLYANPFRLYLLMSIFFFFSLNQYLSKKESRKSLIDTSTIEKTTVDFSILPDSANQKLNTQLSQAIINELHSERDSGFVYAFSKLNGFKKKKVTLILDDRLQQSLGIEPDDSFKDYNAQVGLVSETSQLRLNTDEIDFWILQKHMYNFKLSDEDLLDSMQLGEISDFSRFVYLQLIRVLRSDSQSVSKYIVGNASIAMFIMVPIYGLLLLLFYYRSKKYYVEHLIHSIQLHSFGFFVYGVVFVLLYTFSEYSIRTPTLIATFLLLLVYFFSSLKRVYKKSFWSTFIRFIFAGLVYYVFLFFAILTEIFISFLLY